MVTVKCRGCGRTGTHEKRSQIPICKTCGYCTRYCGCRCVECRDCHKTHGPQGFCSCCARCKTVCVCRKKPGAAKMHKVTTLRNTLTGAQKIFNPLQRALGLEIELAEWGTLRRGTLKHSSFNVVHDGSVRPSGQEMVVEPLIGDKFLQAMVELGTQLATKNCKVNETCGLHVHVDGTDLSYWHLRRLVRMYLKYETEIYRSFVTADRATNRYCRLFDNYAKAEIANIANECNTAEVKRGLYRIFMGDMLSMPTKFELPTPITVRALERNGLWGLLNDGQRESVYRGDVAFLEEFVKSGVIAKLMYNKILDAKSRKYGQEDGYEETRSHRTRYFGLNVFSWFHRGTIEWRMKEGTLNVEDLICWPLFCGWMVELATQISDSHIEKLPTSVVELFKDGVATHGLEGKPRIIKPPSYVAAWLAKQKTTRTATVAA